MIRNFCVSLITTKKTDSYDQTMLNENPRLRAEHCNECKGVTDYVDGFVTEKAYLGNPTISA
jgi:hypothetical protein